MTRNPAFSAVDQASLISARCAQSTIDRNRPRRPPVCDVQGLHEARGQLKIGDLRAIGRP
jgi:hypothetical protein